LFTTIDLNDFVFHIKVVSGAKMCRARAPVMWGRGGEEKEKLVAKDRHHKETEYSEEHVLD